MNKKTDTKQARNLDLLADIITKRRAGGIKPRPLRYKFTRRLQILPVHINQKRPTINIVRD